MQQVFRGMMVVAVIFLLIAKYGNTLFHQLMRIIKGVALTIFAILLWYLTERNEKQHLSKIIVQVVYF